ncbi:MAG: SurA N-terminal domain-containing protein [Porticoccaceae bacterium]|nr:SurA N-terminal domain-containing protein [Porticoccaceae bacterium]MDG1312132.1 SurA N-terminal domain-containing protein [Porticoccaceae bacterium]
MLDSFRSNMRGIATVIVVFIGGIFAFSGTGSLFISGTGAEAVLIVNDESVSALRVQQVLSSEKQRILRSNEGLDPALLDDELIRPQVIQQLIARKVIAQSASEQGLGVSSKAVSELLLATEGFQSDGRFNQEVFQFVIRNQGYTSATFVEMVKEDLLIQQFIQGLSNTNFVTEGELANLASFTEQERDYYYLTLPMKPIVDAIDISDQQIADHYHQSKDQYQTQVQVSVESIELSASELAAEQTVTEKQIQARFDQEAESINTADSLQAAHILLTDPDAEILQEIRGKLDAGGNFAALAKEYSDDFASADAGGELGFTTGDTFPEAFETALAALEIGQVSAAVETDAGTHFIKLLDRQQETFELSAEGSRIEQELLREAASDLLVEKLEMLKELSFNSETLAEVAADLGLEAQVSEPFSRVGGAGVAAFPAVVKAAFSSEVLEDKYASEVLDLGDERYVVIKLQEYFPARQKELDEVKVNVAAALRGSIAQQTAEEQGGALLARVEAGESVEAVAKSAGLEWQAAQNVKRVDRSVNEEVKAAVFQLDAPADKPTIKGFSARNGDYIVASLQTVTSGDASKLSQEQKSSLIYTLQSTNSSRDLAAYQASLLAEAEVNQ